MTAVGPRALDLRDDPLLGLIVGTLRDRKALDLVVIDLRGVSDAADYFVVCSGTSEPHIRALTDDLVEELRGQGHRPWHVEGRQSLRWVLVDLVDVVVHIFRPEAREFYALERLWGDAPAARPGDGWEEEPVAEDSAAVLEEDRR